jgi:hypothetical protein
MSNFQVWLEAELETTRIKHDTIAVDVYVDYTTYDSPRAYCYDGSDVIVEMLSLEEPNFASILEDKLKAIDFSDPSRPEEEDYSYGHRLRFIQYTPTNLRAKADKLQADLVKIQDLLKLK